MPAGISIPEQARPNPPSALNLRELHPTFGAEIQTPIDLENVPKELFQEILAAVTKYGFIVLSNSVSTDSSHIAFSRRFGDLDDIRPYITADRKPRYEFYELFDAGNVDDATSAVLAEDSARAHYGKGNGFFHVDSSFNPRRASYSLPRAVKLPPPGTGGNTQFANTRSAFETLPGGMKERLLKEDHVGTHSLHHSRKRGSPEYFKDLNPLDFPMHRHRIAQLHQRSGRMNLYIGSHMRHVEGLV